MSRTEAHPRQSTMPQVWDSLKKSVFVIGSALLVFIATRNSVTWHIQHFWGASGDFWQTHWLKIHTWFGGDPLLMGMFGTVAVSTISYWLYNVFFLFLDVFGPPPAILKYKVQPEENIPVDPYKLRRCIKQIIFNQIVGAIPMYVVYRMMLLRGMGFGSELPTFQRVVFEFFCMAWVEEIGFYYSHRLLHHSWFYKRIHKQHHEWTASISLVSIYAHPVEHIMSNLLPPLLGPLIMGSHISTTWLWFALLLASTTVAHSGYHLPFFPSPEAHDFHHLKFNCNYGAIGILDRLHGTDAPFLRSKQYQRHFMLTSLSSARDIVPDESGKTKEKN